MPLGNRSSLVLGAALVFGGGLLTGNVLPRFFKPSSLSQSVTAAGVEVCHRLLPKVVMDQIKDLPKMPDRPCSHDDGKGSELVSLLAAAALDASDADFSLQNAGVAKKGLSGTMASQDEIDKALPYKNRIQVHMISGDRLKEMLEKLAEGLLQSPRNASTWPYAAGLRFEVDYSLPRDARIKSLEVFDRQKGSWTPIEATKAYKVAVNDYIGAGKDGYTALAQSSPQATSLPKDSSVILSEYLKKNQGIHNL